MNNEAPGFTVGAEGLQMHPSLRVRRQDGSEGSVYLFPENWIFRPMCVKHTCDLETDHVGYTFEPGLQVIPLQGTRPTLSPTYDFDLDGLKCPLDPRGQLTGDKNDCGAHWRVMIEVIGS